MKKIKKIRRRKKTKRRKQNKEWKQRKKGVTSMKELSTKVATKEIRIIK